MSAAVRWLLGFLFVAFAASALARPEALLGAPAAGTRYIAPAAITLEAQVTVDAGRTVASVEYLADGDVIGTVTAAPYVFSWTNVPRGNYTLRARVTDDQGAQDASRGVAVRVRNNDIPRVRLSAPAPHRYIAPGTIALTATVTDRDDPIARVEFFQGATLLAALTSEPYTFTWTGVPAGRYELTAKATDSLGATGTSNVLRVRVRDNRAPHVRITAPANGAAFAAPATIAVSIRANDPDDNLDRVELLANGSLLAAFTAEPFDFTWSNVQAGTPTLTARATDDLGLTTTSRPVTIQVTGAANQPPVGSITAPTANQVFNAPATITVTATASDPDGTVARVDFYNGATLIGSATAAPYSATLSNLAAGTYSLTAVATDNQGASTTSAAVPIIVNASPTVSVSSPAAGTVFTAPANVTVTASATDADGTIAKVDFYQDGTLIGTASSSSYSATASGLGSGSYGFTAIATDNQGATATSAAVSIRVNGLPTVSITSPTNGAGFTAPATINLAATAADSDGAIAKVEFFRGTTLIASVTMAPYTYAWTDVAQGSYMLRAVATDDLGEITTSAPITISVAPPTLKGYYIHADHLNTPRLIADDQQRTVWRWDQTEPFGSNPPDENPSGLGIFDLPLRLPGQYYDKESGLHYNYFRDYDPSLGRYAEFDLVGLGGGINGYTYAFDPLSQIDPVGLMGRAPGTQGIAPRNPPSAPSVPGYVPVVQAISILVPAIPFPGVIGDTSCGSYGFQAPNVLDGALIERSCRNHDRCYETCGVWKDDCDRRFRDDIRRDCGFSVRCVVGAQIYYSVAQRYGEKAFLDARERCRQGPCGQ